MRCSYDELVALAGVMRWLSLAFWTPLGAHAVEYFATGDGIAHLEEYARVLDFDVSAPVPAIRSALGQGGPDVVQRLNVESTYLFKVGSKEPPAPPYESVWVDPERLVLGPSVHSVLAAYHEAGVKVAADSGDLVPDHFCRECEFVAHCCVQAAQALERFHQEQADEWCSRAERFLDEHLSRWAPAFFEAVIAAERSEFFSAASRIGLVVLSSRATA